ncbi:MAG: bacillithiol biosynthesis deacetylase BshB1 [Planctomycetota bacterium]
MIDVLAVGAHPDDVELRIGGTLAALRRLGHSFSILHLTQGERATRGSVAHRKEEAARAADILGADQHQILDLGDGRLEENEVSRQAVIAVIRAQKPSLLLAPFPEDEHPDHAAAGRIAHAAWYLAGIPRVPPESVPPHRPRALWFYPGHQTPAASLVVELAKEDLDRKFAAIRCYSSQFHDPDSTEPETRISHPSFLDGCLGRLRFFGSQIGTAFGEPFITPTPPRIQDPMVLFS